MAFPVITGGSYVSINTTTGLSGTLNIPVSASGNDRVVLIASTLKGNSVPAAKVNTIGFDSSGVNLSIGNGVSEIGVRNLAIEGSFSNSVQLYLIKEDDLPSVAGTYACNVALDVSPQYGFWEAWEVKGAKGTLDAIKEIIEITNVSAGVNFSDSVISTMTDCLIIDMWATSHSSTPSFAANQNQLGVQNRTNGGVVLSWINKAAAGSQTMVENSSSLHQRRAGKIISIAPPSAIVSTDIRMNVQFEDTTLSSILKLVSEVSSSIQFEDATVISNISVESDISSEIQLQDTLVSGSFSKTSAVQMLVQFEDVIVSSELKLVSKLSSSVQLEDSIFSGVMLHQLNLSSNIQIEDTIVYGNLSTNDIKDGQFVNLVEGKNKFTIIIETRNIFKSNVSYMNVFCANDIEKTYFINKVAA